MSYCAHCGSQIKTRPTEWGKLKYHPGCYQDRLVEKAKASSALSSLHEKVQLEKKRVKHINENKIDERDLRDLNARISMINTPTLRLVK